jgi:hypothetical protein
MKFSKATAIPILLIILLGAIGFSYAWWTETLLIDDNVNTGYVNVIFNNDPWEHASVWATSPATASLTWVNEHTLQVTFSNLYPGCEFRVLAYIRNMGTIPVKFDRCNITVTEDPKNVAPHIFVVPGDTYMNYDTDGNGPLPRSSAYCPVWGGYSNFPFTLLDDAINYGNVPGWPNTYAWPKCVLNPPTTPGDWRTAGWMGFGGEDGEGCIRLKLNPDAPNDIEGASLTFTISFKFVQWNAP